MILLCLGDIGDVNEAHPTTVIGWDVLPVDIMVSAAEDSAVPARVMPEHQRQDTADGLEVPPFEFLDDRPAPAPTIAHAEVGLPMVVEQSLRVYDA